MLLVSCSSVLRSGWRRDAGRQREAYEPPVNGDGAFRRHAMQRRCRENPILRVLRFSPDEMLGRRRFYGCQARIGPAVAGSSRRAAAFAVAAGPPPLWGHSGTNLRLDTPRRPTPVPWRALYLRSRRGVSLPP